MLKLSDLNINTGDLAGLLTDFNLLQTVTGNTMFSTDRA